MSDNVDLIEEAKKRSSENNYSKVLLFVVSQLGDWVLPTKPAIYGRLLILTINFVVSQLAWR
jgi:hypothetical protein